MTKCTKGKNCGSSCIERSDKCRKNLSPSGNSDLLSTRRLIEGLFGPQSTLKSRSEPQSPDQKVLDDISRLMRGEEPLFIPLSRDVKSRGSGEVTRLQDALGLGELTRQEVGRDWQVLREEALRRKDELRKEIKKQQILGTTKAKAKEKELKRELEELNQALKAGESGKKEPISQATREARIGAKYFDQSFSPERSISGKAADYDWEGNARQGTNGKKGGFGSVLFQGDVVVKRGDLGERELEILRRVGEAGLGPELIYGEIGRRKETFASVGIHEGRVAMSRVEGREIGGFTSSQERIGDSTVGNIYWRARAELHRLGIAHNDAHGGNVIVDGTGKPRFVDFGISQDNPKAALSEALGGIVNRSVIPPGAVIIGGMNRDYQSSLVKTSGITEPAKDQPENLRRIYSNLTTVKSHLRSMGLNNDEIAQILTTGIRNPLGTYNKGAWGKLTNDDALQIINMLYNGI
jgi:hypothetical protein